MAETVSMRVGETRQLRGPVGEIERWTSSAPGIATVSDEDIVNGLAGGLVQALSVGRTRISAAGFEGTLVVDVEISVEGAPAVRVASGEKAVIPGAGAAAHWTVDNPRVARVVPPDEVQGGSPGIAILRGGVAELRVEVTGSLEAEVGGALELRPHFSVPVRAWRTSSSGVSVNASGTVTTGDRPRTVEVTAELEDGSSFSFDLRVVARRAASPGPITGAVSQPAFTPPAPTAAADLEARQSQEVARHIQLAEAAVEANDCQAARTQLSAAEVAAAGRENLIDLVRRTGERLRSRVAAQAAGVFDQVGTDLLNGEYRQVEQVLSAVPSVSDWQALVENLRGLCQELARADGEGGESDRLPPRFHDAWRAAAGSAQFSLLPVLGRIGMERGVDDAVSTIIRTLVDRAAAGSCPVSVREALESLLREAGAEPLETALSMLSDRATATETCDSLIMLLPGLAPARHGRAVVRLFAGLPAPSQTLLAGRLAKLAEVSFGALCDLLAGVLQCLPPDARLAKAVQRQLGSEQLEREAVKWASHNHDGARTVLRRLYEYSAGALGGR